MGAICERSYCSAAAPNWIENALKTSPFCEYRQNRFGPVLFVQ
jgi:hypothetical protein